METKSKVTYLNIINTIDSSILELKKVRGQTSIPLELNTRITKILSFIKDINNEDYEIILHNKGIYIEREPLENFHSNFKNTLINNQDIDSVLNLLKAKNLEADSSINKIQDILIKISLPLWESLHDLK